MGSTFIMTLPRWDGAAQAHRVRPPVRPARAGAGVALERDGADEQLVERLPASASSDYGEPFGKVLKDAVQ